VIPATSTPSALLVERLCAAVFTDSDGVDDWHRGLVTKIAGPDTFEIFYFDFGSRYVYTMFKAPQAKTRASYLMQ
jgi:hypothetical protein